jgi:uncharacterized protein
MEVAMIPVYGTNYSFEWKDLGDIVTGRPNLGAEVPVLVYRLGQYTMREALVQHYSQETAAILLREAGWIAGREFCKNMLDCSLDFGAFVDQLQAMLKSLKIGIMRLELSDLTTMTFTLTVSEDLDCSGLPISGKTVCEYDEGFIAGILHMYTGKDFAAIEVDCWATGDRTCRFLVKQEVTKE